ncbi:MAG: hypothetical protein HQK54_00015 [Oligoflexales bacterium]|nr:hypothetical protein [Oligoflexales bacterium]
MADIKMRDLLNEVRRLRSNEISTSKVKVLDEIERYVILAMESDSKVKCFSYFSKAQSMLATFIPTKLFG